MPNDRKSIFARLRSAIAPGRENRGQRLLEEQFALMHPPGQEGYAPADAAAPGEPGEQSTASRGLRAVASTWGLRRPGQARNVAGQRAGTVSAVDLAGTGGAYTQLSGGAPEASGSGTYSERPGVGDAVVSAVAAYNTSVKIVGGVETTSSKQRQKNYNATRLPDPGRIQDYRGGKFPQGAVLRIRVAGENALVHHMGSGKYQVVSPQQMKQILVYDRDHNIGIQGIGRLKDRAEAPQRTVRGEITPNPITPNPHAEAIRAAVRAVNATRPGEPSPLIGGPARRLPDPVNIIDWDGQSKHTGSVLQLGENRGWAVYTGRGNFQIVSEQQQSGAVLTDTGIQSNRSALFGAKSRDPQTVGRGR
jgi:hypothetical protein